MDSCDGTKKGLVKPVQQLSQNYQNGVKKMRQKPKQTSQKYASISKNSKHSYSCIFETYVLRIVS